jgi:outer membrane protein assembly factor BamB
MSAVVMTTTSMRSMPVPVGCCGPICRGLVTTTPAVANGVVYFGSSDGNLYALNATTGGKLWSFNTGDDPNTAVTVANGVVYFGVDNNLILYALDAKAVANGVVYVGGVIGFPNNGHVYALNASTGAQLWGDPTDVGNGSPIVSNGVVYFTGSRTNTDLTSVSKLYAFSVGADLFLRATPSTTTVHQGDLLTYSFPVWNLGPSKADHEVLNTQVPAGSTFDHVTISGTPGLGRARRRSTKAPAPLCVMRTTAWRQTLPGQ